MHYNNLVVKVWLKVEVGSHTHTTVSLLYTRKKSGKIIFIREKSGNYQGISFLDFCGHPDLSCLLNLYEKKRYQTLDIIDHTFKGKQLS